MEQLYRVLIVLHIAGGTIGLISGTIATAVIKGKKAHTINGKIFFYSMLVTALSALVISNLPNHKSIFLFAVGGFTLYMICSGYRIVWLKRNLGKSIKTFSFIDYAITTFAFLFGAFLIVQGIRGVRFGNTFGVVPIVFGVICFNYGVLDCRTLFGKSTVKASWITSHIAKMIGALIACYTAVLVVNVQIQQQWILWLLPTVIGLFLIGYYINKYRPAKRGKLVSNIG